MYGAVVRNAGIRPVKVTVCDAVTDAMQREIGVRHAIERRNESTGQWSVFWQIPRAEWCRPYPTGIVKGEISEAWLWPGQVLQTGEIAIQASDGLALNDRLRFVVYPYDTAGQAVLGEAFVVDERPTR